jgi:lipooligosaccharide transport system permease protein
LQVAVEVMPLFHAVELMRGLTTGVIHAGLLGHLGYFLAMIVAGLVVAARRLDVLLLK